MLVSYGDQYEVLGFQDLIRIDRGRDGGTEVRLRSFEYDLTRAIKKASSGFRSVDSLFAALRDPVELALYVTPGTLPADLDEPHDVVAEAARALAERSGGALVFRQIDPGPEGSEGRQELADRYGLRPIAASLFSTETYYFDLILESGDQTFIVRAEDEYSAASVTAAVEAALKRVAPGFLRTIGVRLPPAGATQDPFGRPQQPFASWQLLQQQLADDYAVQRVDLSRGEVPAQVDCLLVVAPQAMSDRERFAVDQYLMRGGALLVADRQPPRRCGPIHRRYLAQPRRGGDGGAACGLRGERGGQRGHGPAKRVVSQHHTERLDPADPCDRLPVLRGRTP